eukprot:jgi/Mesvir1/4545/Mv12439-RA.1
MSSGDTGGGLCTLNIGGAVDLLETVIKPGETCIAFVNDGAKPRFHGKGSKLAANMKAACRSDMFLKTRPGIPLRLANVDTLRVPAVVNGINDAMGAYGVWASGVGGAVDLLETVIKPGETCIAFVNDGAKPRFHGKGSKL